MKSWACKDYPFNPKDNQEKRTKFEHDKDEITYSRAFRRLYNKTQIIVKPVERDHFRSRLTHTLEVNSIAQFIGRNLSLNENLINAIALGHDLGHTPFGHAGEREIKRIAEEDVLLKDKKNSLKKNFNSIIQKNGGKKHYDYNDIFHHAINSTRIVYRKMKGISDETIFGIITHGWSPWKKSTELKFGIPYTYEAQVVAIADQIAAINHDIEDIMLIFQDNKKTFKVFRDSFLDNSDRKDKDNVILNEWFLPETGEEGYKNGWNRKKRLQKIINSIIESSLPILKRNKCKSLDAIKINITLDPEISSFLYRYEQFVRENILKKNSWFVFRDSAAAAIIRMVYNLYKSYIPQILCKDEESEKKIDLRLKPFIKRIKKYVESKEYCSDLCFEIISKHLKKDPNKKKREIMLKIIDYISGMTDNHIMDIYYVALALFGSKHETDFRLI